MRFLADDNTIHPTAEDCIKHEEEVLQAKMDEEKRKTEEKKRFKEVKAAYDHADKLADQFLEDFGYTSKSNLSIFDIIDKMFK